MAISYNPQKDLFNVVYHPSIKRHLTPNFKGFVVGSQIFQFDSAPYFDHNSCKPGLNEQGFVVGSQIFQFNSCPLF